MLRLIAPALLAALPATAQVIADDASYACTVNYACADGSCQAVARDLLAEVSMFGLVLSGEDRVDTFVTLDRTSGGDLIFGGQMGERLYGIFMLPQGGGAAKLIIEGVNGWSESRTELMICGSATK